MSTDTTIASATDAGVRFTITPAGAAALAMDEAIQARMNDSALDEIADLLRHSALITDRTLIARIAEQVAATRRTVRHDQRG